MAESIETTDANLPLDQLIACPECDLLMRRTKLAAGQKAECPRCGYGLAVEHHNVVGRSLALVVAALLLFIPANFLPIMHLSLLGRVREDTIWSGVMGLYEAGMPAVALIVLLSSMVVPALKLLCQFMVLLTIKANDHRQLGLRLYRIYHHLRDWGMLEVYLLGILVSMIKLKDTAELQLGVGLACFVGLLFVQVALEVVMSPQQIWDALSEPHE